MMFHITKTRNIEKILSEGIIPGKQSRIKGLTVTSQPKHENVFLTNDVGRIVDTQLGRSSTHEWSVISVDERNFNYQQHRYKSNGTYTLSDFEFITNKIEIKDILNITTLDNYLKVNGLNVVETPLIITK